MRQTDLLRGLPAQDVNSLRIMARGADRELLLAKMRGLGISKLGERLRLEQFLRGSSREAPDANASDPATEGGVEEAAEGPVLEGNEEGGGGEEGGVVLEENEGSEPPQPPPEEGEGPSLETNEESGEFEREFELLGRQRSHAPPKPKPPQLRFVWGPRGPPGPSASAPSAAAPRPVRLAFWSGHLCERGTDTAMFDYADHAERTLGFTSFVIYDVSSRDNFGGTVAKFRARFGERLVGLGGWDEVDPFLASERITHLYLIKIVTERHKVARAPGVRTLVHAVFHAHAPHGDAYARISPCVPTTVTHPSGATVAAGVDVPIVPHIVPKAEPGPDLRSELGIPADATVFGRHGGWETFDIPFVRDLVVEIARAASADAASPCAHIYFVLMNTPPICDPTPHIIHVERTSEPARKAAFIRTCDAMLHARQGGETFGLAIGEFSSHNKPVLTSNDPAHTDNGGARYHLDVLGERGVYYRDKKSLLQQIITFDRAAARQKDNNCYRAFEPQVVMETFRRVLIDGADRAHAAREASGGAAGAEEAPRLDPELEKVMREADAELAETVRIPAEPMRALDTEELYQVEFRPFVYVRLAPSTCAAAVRQLAHGARVRANARRGKWVRVCPEAGDPPGAERWVLTVSPVYGRLLSSVEG